MRYFRASSGAWVPLPEHGLPTSSTLRPYTRPTHAISDTSFIRSWFNRSWCTRKWLAARDPGSSHACVLCQSFRCVCRAMHVCYIEGLVSFEPRMSAELKKIVSSEPCMCAVCGGTDGLGGGASVLGGAVLERRPLVTHQRALQDAWGERE